MGRSKCSSTDQGANELGTFHATHQHDRLDDIYIVVKLRANRSNFKFYLWEQSVDQSKRYGTNRGANELETLRTTIDIIAFTIFTLWQNFVPIGRS